MRRIDLLRVYSFRPSCRFLSSSSPKSPSKTPSTSGDDSATGATTADGRGISRDKWKAIATPPRAIFPWRHEVEPLPRLIDREVDGGLLGPGVPNTAMPPFGEFLFRHFVFQAAAAQLNIPWYERLLSSKWKQDLADGSAWAFSRAVAGVLSNTYRVPYDDILSHDDVDFQHTTKFGSSQDEEQFPESEFMLDEKLRNLYEAAHDSGKEQMLIHLQMKPMSSKLKSMMFIPFLTRAAVKDCPALRHTFRNMAMQLVEKERELGRNLSTGEAINISTKQMKELALERVKNHADGYGVLEGTVIAQVLVNCNEVFSVKDLATDKLVQGDGQERYIPHLVRLEMVVEGRFYDNGLSTSHISNWVITDWDDLLGGNLWFI